MHVNSVDNEQSYSNLNLIYGCGMGNCKHGFVNNRLMKSAKKNHQAGVLIILNRNKFNGFDRCGVYRLKLKSRGYEQLIFNKNKALF